MSGKKTTGEPGKQGGLPLVVREARSSEHNYILSSWKLSLREAFPMASPTDFYKWAKKVIDPMARDSEILVAVPKDGPDLVVGWLAHGGSQDRLNYTYVRAKFRQRGVYQLLKREADLFSIGLKASFWTPWCAHVNRHMTYQEYPLVYDPTWL